MTSEIALSSLADTVKDRVRKVIFDSLPDGAIEALIDKELNEFTKGDNWRKSLLSQMVERTIKDNLGERVSKDVAAYLDEHYIKAPKEIVQKSIAEIAPLVMNSISASIADSCVNSLRNQMSSKGIYL